MKNIENNYFYITENVSDAILIKIIFSSHLTDNTNPNILIFNLASAIRKKRKTSETGNGKDPFSSLETFHEGMWRRHPFQLKFSDVGLGDGILPEESERVKVLILESAKEAAQ